MSEPAPRISERYHPTRLLGEGGFGEVWQAFDAVRREPVALKLMSRVVAEEARLRFQREAAALLGLDHPCIVRALGQGTTTDGIPFLVTELLRGQELRQRLTEQLSLSVPETADILQQICAGLSYM
ncbi:MAG TPA: protein kinase, partial [Polyangiaceae bacterium]|nr:protein kinase [Polyangiaceae bacterium]